MAKDVALNSNRDLGFENGDIYFVEDLPEVKQQSEVKLLVIQGEYNYDFTRGIDWKKSFDPMTPAEVTEAQVRAKLLTIPEIDAVTQMESSRDVENQGGLVRWYGTTIYGNVTPEDTE